MAIGTSLFLVAVGAILYWAVEFDIVGIDIDAVGVILMVIGIAGLLISLIMLVASGERGPGGTAPRRERYVERDRNVY